jgi:hypothetical protein
MAEDISKTTLVALVVLTVVISLLGTWTVLTEVNNLNTGGRAVTGPSQQNVVSQGEVGLVIGSTEPPKPLSETTGKVVLGIF